MKNGLYQRILQPSEHPKRVGAKNFYFFKTLLDGPLFTCLLCFRIFNFRNNLCNDMQFYGLRGKVNGWKPYEKLVKYESRTVKLNYTSTEIDLEASQRVMNNKEYPFLNLFSWIHAPTERTEISRWVCWSSLVSMCSLLLSDWSMVKRFWVFL